MPFFSGPQQTGGDPSRAPKGYPGEKGIDGDYGDQGEVGEPGVVIGPRGERGEKGLRGLQGDQGKKGKPGIPGPDGGVGMAGMHIVDLRKLLSISIRMKYIIISTDNSNSRHSFSLFPLYCLV